MFLVCSVRYVSCYIKPCPVMPHILEQDQKVECAWLRGGGGGLSGLGNGVQSVFPEQTITIQELGLKFISAPAELCSVCTIKLWHWCNTGVSRSYLKMGQKYCEVACWAMATRLWSEHSLNWLIIMVRKVSTYGNFVPGVLMLTWFWIYLSPCAVFWSCFNFRPFLTICFIFTWLCF